MLLVLAHHSSLWQIPLQSLPVLQQINTPTHLGVVCEFPQGGLSPLIQIINKYTEQDIEGALGGELNTDHWSLLVKIIEQIIHWLFDVRRVYQIFLTYNFNSKIGTQ